MEKKHFPKIILTERLEIKQHELDHAETVFRYVDQDRQRLRQFLPWVDKTEKVDGF